MPECCAKLLKNWNMAKVIFNNRSTERPVERDKVLGEHDDSVRKSGRERTNE